MITREEIQLIKQGYEHNNDELSMYLLEDTADCVDRIMEIFSDRDYRDQLDHVTGWDYESYWAACPLSRDEALDLLQHIRGNIDLFLESFSGWYVGDYCIDSISWGCYEEDLVRYACDEQSIDEVRQLFESEGFCTYERKAWFDYDSKGSKIDLHPNSFVADWWQAYRQKQVDAE